MKCKANQLSVNGICERFDTPCIKEACRFFQPPMTNADRIRAMSDEELAKMLRNAYDAGCDDASAWEYGTRQYSFTWDEEWLRQPAEEVQSNA